VNTVSPVIVASIESAKTASSPDLSARLAPAELTITSPCSTLTRVALARSLILALPGPSVTVTVVRGLITNLPIAPRSIDAMPSCPVVMMLPLYTVAPASVEIPFNESVPVPPRTPAGAFRAAVTGASSLELLSSLLLASVVSELKQNKLDTASASNALSTTFEFNVCIVNPPHEPGRTIVKRLRQASPDYGKPT